MKVRFEALGKNCEKCGKPAKWRCYEVSNAIVVRMNNMHHYCDKCVKEK